MRRHLALDPLREPPEPSLALHAQGVPLGATVPETVRRITELARERYAELVHPRAVLAEIAPAEFATVYAGEGHNARRTPLESLFGRAERLALFAATLGEPIAREIRALFDRREPALAYALDAVASERADAAALLLAGNYLAGLREANEVTHGARCLPYSPGYCGWHVTGQRRLFDYLEPEGIGMTLNASSMMQPLKSVSGVLVVAAPPIHDFVNDFDFCSTCGTLACRARIAALYESAEVRGD